MAAAPASERRLAASIAAHESWAHTPDRAARTVAARAAYDASFLTAAGGDPVRAEHLRRAHYQRLALASARARRKVRQHEDEAAAAEAELDALNGDVSTAGDLP